jgi:hypothetical protein
MKVVYSDTHKDHDPQLFMVRGKLKRSNEQPERAFRLLEAVEQEGHEIVATRDFGAARAPPSTRPSTCASLKRPTRAGSCWTIRRKR